MSSHGQKRREDSTKRCDCSQLVLWFVNALWCERRGCGFVLRLLSLQVRSNIFVFCLSRNSAVFTAVYFPSDHGSEVQTVNSKHMQSDSAQHIESTLCSCCSFSKRGSNSIKKKATSRAPTQLTETSTCVHLKSNRHCTYLTTCTTGYSAGLLLHSAQPQCSVLFWCFASDFDFMQFRKPKKKGCDLTSLLK